MMQSLESYTVREPINVILNGAKRSEESLLE
jgi:hypothetical protein